MNPNRDETVEEVQKAIQNIVCSWGNLLIATKGVLQQETCLLNHIFSLGPQGLEIQQQQQYYRKFGVKEIHY
jgi:hypothetical protein